MLSGWRRRVCLRRPADGLFDQDQARRLKYFAYLRAGASPVAAQARPMQAHVTVKTEMLQLRLMEKRKELVKREDVDALVDAMAGTVLTHLSGMAARCSRDLVVRRNIDAVVTQIRREISEACSKMADERGEPPLDEQD